MQRMPRRTFLVHGGALAATPLGAAAREPDTDAAWQKSLAALLDALLPGDDQAPSAGELDIAAKLLAGAARRPAAIDLLSAGCRWLDERARAAGAADFAALDGAAQTGIVATAAAAAPGSVPRRLFDSVRWRAFELYYGDPRAWAAVAYDGPPQPRGFPDYDEPPAAR